MTPDPAGGETPREAACGWLRDWRSSPQVLISIPCPVSLSALMKLNSRDRCLLPTQGAARPVRPAGFRVAKPRPSSPRGPTPAGPPEPSGAAGLEEKAQLPFPPRLSVQEGAASLGIGDPQPWASAAPDPTPSEPPPRACPIRGPLSPPEPVRGPASTKAPRGAPHGASKAATQPLNEGWPRAPPATNNGHTQATRHRVTFCQLPCLPPGTERPWTGSRRTVPEPASPLHSAQQPFPDPSRSRPRAGCSLGGRRHPRAGLLLRILSQSERRDCPDRGSPPGSPRPNGRGRWGLTETQAPRARAPLADGNPRASLRARPSRDAR